MSDVPIGILATPHMEDIARRVSEAIPRDLPHEYIPIEMRRFADGEIYVQIMGNVRNRDIFIIHSMRLPDVSTGTLAAHFVLDAAVGASAKDIYFVVPEFSYARQDRKDKPRTAKSFRRVVQSLEIADRISFIMFDLHGKQLQSVFNNPVDELPGWLPFRSYLNETYGHMLDDVVFVGADGSAMYRVEQVCTELNAPHMGFIKKKRDIRTGKATAERYVGDDLQGRIAIPVDDMVDSGGTQEQLAKLLYEAGAKEVVAMATHAILSKKDDTEALDRLRRAKVKLITTNTIPRDDQFYQDNRDVVTVLPIEGIIAQTIYRSSMAQSVSEMWTGASPK